MRASDTLSRISGDEFIVLLPDLDREEDAQPVLERLVQAAARDHVIEGRDIRVSASAGVTFYPQTEEVDDEALLRQADAAMYVAKRAGRGRLQAFEARDAAEDPY
ncbi:GGDEF domain-containing protein [Guyparkeria sp. GHLCS8-2]|uniref:diguanylate cyclase domain-containing protein n=1 Tax=Guyparkeria halopsychrophila TaxID=3139421 RepID=UPI0037C6242A